MSDKRYDLLDMDTGVHLAVDLSQKELAAETKKYEQAGWEVHPIDSHGFLGFLSLDNEALYNTGYYEDWMKLHRLRKQYKYPMCKLIGRRFTRMGFSGTWKRVTAPLVLPEPWAGEWKPSVSGY